MELSERRPWITTLEFKYGDLPYWDKHTIRKKKLYIKEISVFDRNIFSTLTEILHKEMRLVV